MGTEKLKMKIGVSGTFWDKRPEYSISVSGTEYAKGTISAESGVTEYIEFEADLAEDSTHTLEIKLLNKEDSDVQKDNYEDPINFNIIGDMLLNIESIVVDDIDLGNLRYTKSNFKLAVPNEFNGNVTTEIPNCVNLGWNGSYLLEFTTPFYIWLLESL